VRNTTLLWTRWIRSEYVRKPSPEFSGEGLVDSSLSSYLLQHLPGQHFALLLQQSAVGDDAVALPMNAAKMAIKKRYFIDPPF
jgi:hypothetical protein